MYSNNFIRAFCMMLLSVASLALANLPKLTQKNTEFMFDIHDVLLDINETLRKKYKKELISEIKIIIWHDAKQFETNTLFKLIPSIMWLNIGYHGASGEAYYHLLKEYNKLKCADLVRKISRTYKPIEEMILVVDNLHSQGFCIRAGSNVGSTFYNDLVEDHPQVFDHFEQGTYVEFTRADGSFSWNIIKKPSHDFFKKHYDEHLKNSSKKYCVFIDDKRANVDAANNFECEEGYRPFIAFHFDRSLPTVEKSIAKLCTELHEYGIEI